MQRRTFLKLAMLTTGAASVGIGIDKLSQASSIPTSFSSKSYFGGQSLEAKIINGRVEANPDVTIRHSVCMGCYSSCGNRVKIDKKTNRIMRVQGNPYNPKCAEPTLPYEASLTESYEAFGIGNSGHKYRATVCGKGSATFEPVYDPYRILFPLKRVGERGQGKWKPITWDEMIKETVEGGQLFKEAGDNTYIEGFRQVYNHKEYINPAAPEMGPKTNGLVWNGGGSYGRVDFTQRFVNKSFGSVNYYGHTGT